MSDAANSPPPEVIPVVEEKLVAGKRRVRTGSVRVHKTIEHLRQQVEMPLVRDVVHVKRVEVNQPVTAAPSIREEGDTLIVPVVEEQIIVRKQLVLKEEIHIKRRRVRSRNISEVTLDREHAIIERTGASGEVIARSDGAGSAEKPVLSVPHKSVVTGR